MTVEKFKELARPTSKHVDDEEIIVFVRECEDMYIIPSIGLAAYKALLSESLTEEQKTLLSGGEYTDGCGELKRCAGLQIALAYFVYAKMLRADGSILARSGFMKHDDSYSSHIVDKENVRQYNDVMDVAEKYLNSSMMYAKHHLGNNEAKRVKGTRTRIKAIGD